MTTKHMKRCSISLAINKYKSKSQWGTMSYALELFLLKRSKNKKRKKKEKEKRRKNKYWQGYGEFGTLVYS